MRVCDEGPENTPGDRGGINVSVEGTTVGVGGVDCSGGGRIIALGDAVGKETMLDVVVAAIVGSGVVGLAFGDRVRKEYTSLDVVGEAVVGPDVAGLIFIGRVGDEDTGLDSVGIVVVGPLIAVLAFRNRVGKEDTVFTVFKFVVVGPGVVGLTFYNRVSKEETEAEVVELRVGLRVGLRIVGAMLCNIVARKTTNPTWLGSLWG